jgi:hypothetical protein
LTPSAAWAATVAALAAFVASAGFADTWLEAGNWRIEVATTTNGVAEPRDESEQCLDSVSPEGLARYFAPVLEGVQAECATAELPASAEKSYRFEMTCAGPEFSIVSRSDVTVPTSRAFSMQVEIDTRTQARTAKVVADAHGTWIGPCGAVE